MGVLVSKIQTRVKNENGRKDGFFFWRKCFFFFFFFFLRNLLEKMLKVNN